MHIHNMSTCVLGWWRMKNSWIRYYYISQSCETNISQTYLGCATDLVIANDIDFHLSKEEVLKQIVIKTKVMLILWYTYAYECSYYICVICGTLWTADFSMNPLENVYKWKDFSPNLCRITRIYNHIPQIYEKSRNITMAMKAIPLLRIYNKYLHAHKPFPHTLSIYNLEKMFCIFIAEFNKSPAVYNEFYVWFFYRGKIWYDIQGKIVVSSFEILRDLKTNCKWKVSPGNMENSSRTFFLLVSNVFFLYIVEYFNKRNRIQMHLM